MPINYFAIHAVYPAYGRFPAKVQKYQMYHIFSAIGNALKIGSLKDKIVIPEYCKAMLNKPFTGKLWPHGTDAND